MRIVIAEDSVLLREGLTRLLDAVVVDVRMPPTFTDEGLRAALVVRGRWPDVGVLVADLDARIAALRDLAAREPAAAKTREWHIGILQKQQELLHDCGSRDQQLVAQLTAVPDAFDVIAGRISAAQFDAAELAAYTGGVVEQIEETEKFVQTMRPVTDELLSRFMQSFPERRIAVLAVDPSSPSTLYALASNAILKSTDGGFTWRGAAAGSLTRDVLARGLQPANH